MTPGVLQSAQITFVCALPNGLHARPASHLSEEANRFAAQFALTNLRSGAAADLKSVLAIVAADVRPGDECRIDVEGPDGDAAGEALRHFLVDRLPACDEPIARTAGAPAQELPKGLNATGAAPLFGLPVSAGIGQGIPSIIGGLTMSANSAPSAGPAAEHPRLAEALDKVRSRLRTLLRSSPTGAAAGIVQAHLAILSDVALRDALEQAIASGSSASQAVAAAGQHFAGLLGQFAERPCP